MTTDVSTAADAIVAGDRGALARGITLIESTRADHREAAVHLLDTVVTATGRAIRVGISGPPGVGKSSLIEALGLHVIGAGLELAVLAVDPTSPITGGSVLGDKTRMEELGRSDHAFIRPSPSGTKSGGIARRTRESMLLCEAGGFGVVMVETVGAGQSDVAVADMVDVFVLLVQPSSGDELQGIKRGVMELADLVVVTKADGSLHDDARRSVADYRAALALLNPTETPVVVACSARDGVAIDEVWAAIIEVDQRRRRSGASEGRRARQAHNWLWAEVEDALRERLADDPAVRDLAPQIEAAVAAGTLTPVRGALRLLDAFGPSS